MWPRSLPPARAALAYLFAFIVSALVATQLAACGGGGVVPTTGVSLRALPADFSTRQAAAYSPFRSSNRDTETVTATMIQQDLNLLVAANIRLIRMFDSSDAVTRLTLEVIRDHALDIKVMLGVYIQHGDDAFNQAEIARGVALAKAFPSIVVAVSVGNETMVSWSFNPVDPAVMAGYIRKLRDQITQPVTTDDNWAFFAAAPTVITDQIDFVALHTYPLADSVFTPGSWDWQQEAVPAAQRADAMMNAAVASAQSDFQKVRTYLDGKGLSAMPIVIGETGWKAVASGGETYRAHPVNQKMYVDRLKAWMSGTSAHPTTIVYFEAFDEPWKGGDDKWGLFNVNRQARYVIQSLLPGGNWEAGSYTAADAVYYIPLSSSGPVTANRYSLYSEATVSGEAHPTNPAVFNAWENGTTAAYPELSTGAAPGDGSKSIAITPIPKEWGWGLALGLTSSAEDLSNFAASGTLNFSIKTTYPGKLEVGFFTGSTTLGTAYDVYLPLASGQYGYVNDGNWHQVSIPISAITPFGAMAFGMTDASKAKLDLSKVTSPFVIADRYANTGKATNANITTPVMIDGIYWAR